MNLKNSFSLLLFFIIYFNSIFASDLINKFAELEKMRQNNILTDFYIISNNKKTFSCHKLVLGSHNEYWQKIIYGSFKEGKNNEIVLPYLDETIEVMLKTIYGDIDIQYTISDLAFIELLEFADLSQDKALKAMLEQVLVVIKSTDIFYILDKAIFYKNKKLALAVFNSIKEQNIDDIYQYIFSKVRESHLFIIYILALVKDSLMFKSLQEKYPVFFENNFDEIIEQQRILHINSWSSEEIRNNIGCKDNLILIRMLTKEVIEIAKKLQIDNPKKLLSLFKAHYLLSLKTPTYVTRSIISRTPSSTWFFANKVVKKLMNILDPESLPEAKLCLYKEALTTINEIKLKYKPGPELLHCVTYHFILAYISQKSFQEEFLPKAYYICLEIHEKYDDSNLSSDEILSNIALSTWERDGIGRNHHIEGLKTIMLTVRENM